MKIALLSQKGGVGKSTISRLIATEYARNGWDVKIADMDLSQGTVTEWNRTRMKGSIEPRIAVEQFMTAKDVAEEDDRYDLLIFDGEPHSNKKTLEIAKMADLLILPTGVTVDDLLPTVKLAHELRKNGINRKKINLALSRVGDSQLDIEGAKEYIEEAGYHCLGVLHEKTSIGQAHDSGKAANETPFKTVNRSVDSFIQSAVNRIKTLEEA